MILNKSVLGRHFSDHYTLACGISHTGNAVVLLAFAPMIQLFVDTYGWRGAALLLGGICMHPVASSARVRQSSPCYQPLPDQNCCSSSEDTDASSERALFTRVTKAVDLLLLCEFNFWITFACVSALRVIHDFWMVFYVSHLQAKGISPQVSASLCSFAAFGYLVGTVLFAPFIDRRLIQCSTGVIIASLTASASLVVDPWVNGIPGLAAITFTFGLSLSSLFTLSDVLTKDLLGSDRLSNAFGWIGLLSGFFRLLAGFLPGESRPNSLLFGQQFAAYPPSTAFHERALIGGTFET